MGALVRLSIRDANPGRRVHCDVDRMVPASRGCQARRFGAQIDIHEFVKLYVERRGGAKAKIPEHGPEPKARQAGGLKKVWRTGAQLTER